LPDQHVASLHLRMGFRYTSLLYIFLPVFSRAFKSPSTRTAVGKAFPNELAQAGVTYYLFDNPSQYASWAGANAVTVSPTAFGVTAFNDAFVPIYTAIFESNSNGVLNPNIENTTGNQIGVAVDYLGGYVGDYGIVQHWDFQLSLSSPDYSNQVTADWKTINAITACGTNSLFYGRQDANSQYICSGTSGQGSTLSTAYSTLANNKAILQQAFPTVFKTNNGLFAEQYAAIRIAENTAINSPDFFLNASNRFGCSGEFGQYVAEQSQLPTISNLPSGEGCAPLVTTTVCAKVFSGSSYNWPRGYVLNCGGADDSTANTIETALLTLGALGKSPSYTPIKQFFNSVRSYIFVFPTLNAYTTTFSEANVDYITNLQTGAEGFSYPDSGEVADTGTIYYTILNEQNISTDKYGATPVGVADHELGHVVDWNTSQYSASSQFDNGVQNDFVKLDYLTYDTSKVLPCGSNTTPKYTGPLVSVSDPLSGTTPLGKICTGTTLDGNYSSSSLTTDILRDQFSYFYTQSTSVGPVGFNPGITVLGGWSELFADAFAIVADQDTGGKQKNQTQAVFKNGYLQCTAGAGGWLSQVYTNPTAVPTMPSTCLGTNLPSGWPILH
jgi:hypothetical protein